MHIYAKHSAILSVYLVCGAEPTRCLDRSVGTKSTQGLVVSCAYLCWASAVQHIETPPGGCTWKYIWHFESYVMYNLPLMVESRSHCKSLRVVTEISNRMLRLVLPETAPSRHESCEAHDSLTGRSERLFFDDLDRRQITES